MKSTAFFAGFFLTLFVLVFGTVCFLTVTAPSQYHVLIVGSDQRGTERARSDVLFLVSIPKDGDKKPYVLTIPRDTKIEHDEWGLQKITHFYALGDRPEDGKELGNIDLTESVVEELLDTKIDASFEVTFTSFQEILTELGGGVIDGETVNAEEALALVRDRFTGDRSDFDRQADAREIFRSMLTKVKDPSQLRKVISLANVSPDVRLRYDRSQLVRFLIGAGVSRRGKVEIGEMEEGALPGSGGRIYTPDFGKELYYWIPDEAALQTLHEEHFN
jgi:anionic cell wall polymer biosynthesis LytR-Cps2A-Psr (LCP) family protein